MESTVRDSEDDRRDTNDPHFPARRKRTATSRPKKEVLPKTLHKPPSPIEPQKRSRGRPKKKQTEKKNPKNKAVSSGVSYSDGPFRLV